MARRTDYKEYEASRQWNNKRKVVGKANQLGYRFVNEAVCVMFEAGDSPEKIGEIFGMNKRWAIRILRDMGLVDPAKKCKVEIHKFPEDLLSGFIDGYDGVGSKTDYVRCYLEKHPEVKTREGTLVKRLTRKKTLKDSNISKTDYKTLDESRTWAYQSDLVSIANELGCEYITEAVAKLHGLGLYGTDIADRFERSRCWAISMLDYLGLSKKPRGGIAHHRRNK